MEILSKIFRFALLGRIRTNLPRNS
uniref:Uncharacterized protein n=1 Tax=Anopheles dirus TaxID=7168 RepID=A0A182NYG4_9DIPT